jgi:hypothetical protein
LNPGNLGWRETLGQPQLVIYDFGSVIDAGREAPKAFLDLLRSARSHSSPIPALHRLGFAPAELSVIEPSLTEYMQLLLEPFLCERPYILDGWNRKARAEILLGERRWAFMRAAPPELFGFMRSLHGLFFWHDALKRPFHMRPSLLPYLDADEDQIESRPMTLTDPRPVHSGTQLHVHITRQGETLVKLSLPGHCAGNIENLVDESLRLSLESRNIDLRRVSQQAKESRFAPCLLFKEVIDGKLIHIFLA